jgi:hypothetical protein
MSSPHSEGNVNETAEYSDITTPGENQSRKPPNTFIRVWRKTNHAFGFNKGYKLPLFIIFGVSTPLPKQLTASNSQSGSNARLRPSPLQLRRHRRHVPQIHRALSEGLIYRDGLERYGITIHLSACSPCRFSDDVAIPPHNTTQILDLSSHQWVHCHSPCACQSIW